MNTLDSTKLWSKKSPPHRMLTDAEDRVVSIRKLLRQNFGAKAGWDPRVKEDAVSICALIERLCRRGRGSTAAQVIDLLDLVEELLNYLEELLAILLATRRTHVTG